MRYAAIGDSYSEGVGDELPDGTVRGWADFVAAGLAAALADTEPVDYANFAVRGRLLRPIVTGQLDDALALDPPPDLITVNGGGNDMLRPGVDLPALIGLVDRGLRRCLDAGVRPVFVTGADPTGRLPLGAMVRRRGAYLTAALTEICQREKVTLVDVFADDELRDPRYWSQDRLHLATDGHRRVAGLVLHTLGHGPPPSPAATAAAVVPRGPGANLRYYRRHVLPWVGRRLRGRSSGDNRLPKHPDWHRIAATRP